MFICPTCGREFYEENLIQKHFLSCWKEKNPCHQSTSVPQNESVVREMNDDVVSFFKSFKQEVR